MLLGIGILLVVLWIAGFLLLPTVGLFIHVLLVVAVVTLICHFFRESHRTV
jgi:Family of unknown function (DUF5670)